MLLVHLLISHGFLVTLYLQLSNGLCECLLVALDAGQGLFQCNFLLLGDATDSRRFLLSHQKGRPVTPRQSTLVLFAMCLVGRRLGVVDVVGIVILVDRVPLLGLWRRLGLYDQPHKLWIVTLEERILVLAWSLGLLLTRAHGVITQSHPLVEAVHI